MLDDLESAESDLRLRVPRVHQDVVVDLLPHVVVVDALNHVKHARLQNILDEQRILLGADLGQGQQFREGLRQLLKGVILNEGQVVKHKVQLHVLDGQSQQLIESVAVLILRIELNLVSLPLVRCLLLLVTENGH